MLVISWCLHEGEPISLKQQLHRFALGFIGIVFEKLKEISVREIFVEILLGRPTVINRC